jgi:hypothetical protein
MDGQDPKDREPDTDDTPATPLDELPPPPVEDPPPQPDQQGPFIVVSRN